MSFVTQSINDTEVVDIELGSNRLRWTIINDDCEEEDEVVITNNKVVPNAGRDKVVCSTDISLAAVNPKPGIGYWSSLSDVATIADPTKFNSAVSDLGPSDNTFKWVVTQNGCSGEDYVLFTNNSVNAEAGDVQNVCEDWTIMSANEPNTSDGETGYWKAVVGSLNIEDPLLYDTKVTDIGLGANRLRWTITSTNGCVDSSDVIINNNAVIAAAGLTQDLCKNSTILAAVDPYPATGKWNYESGQATFVDEKKYNTVVDNLNQGTNVLSWTVTAGICVSKSDVIINNLSINADAGDAQQICDNDATLAGNIPYE